MSIELQDDGLVLRLPTEGGPGYGFRLIPKSEPRFQVEDKELSLVFELGPSGAADRLLPGKNGFKRPVTLKTFPDGKWAKAPSTAAPTALTSHLSPKAAHGMSSLPLRRVVLCSQRTGPKAQLMVDERVLDCTIWTLSCPLISTPSRVVANNLPISALRSI